MRVNCRNQTLTLSILFKHRPRIKLWHKNGSFFACPHLEASQFPVGEPTLKQESPKQSRQPRRTKIVFAVDLLTTLGQVAFLRPEVPGLLDLCCSPLCLLHDLAKFPLQNKRRRLRGRWPFPTSTKSARSGRDSCLALQMGCSRSGPPWAHSMPRMDEFSKASLDRKSVV